LFCTSIRLARTMPFGCDAPVTATWFLFLRSRQDPPRYSVAESVAIVVRPILNVRFGHEPDNDDTDPLSSTAGCPSCVTVNVRSDIFTVPVRGAALGFAATTRRTCPPALPCDPVTTVIQLLLDVADHVHPAGVDTTTVTSPPSGPTVSAAGEIVVEH